MRFFLSLLCAVSIFTFTACTKIDYTTLGNEIIPNVDNVNTFDTTLEVITDNFLQGDDTTKLFYNDQMAVGQIRNDPQFGTTDAALFFEVKPSLFPASTTAVNVRDSIIGYDSTVLSLRFTDSYGDTASDVRFEVYQILLNDTISRDTLYNIKKSFATGLMVGSKVVSMRSLRKDSVQVYRSTTSNYKTLNTLRIRLTDAGSQWYNLLKDSLGLSGDTEFRKKFAGFGIKAIPMGGGPGTLAYFSISDTATKLQFYYRKKNGAVPADTTATEFFFNVNNSGFANNVNWNRGAGSELAGHLTIGPGGDSVIYVKTNPGTEVRIRIPGLQNISNRIIHRAELKTYQYPSTTTFDNILTPPPSLYLERYDTANPGRFLSIPFDLSPGEAYGSCFPGNNGIDYSYFGGFGRTEVTNGVSMQAFAFNITRYVQDIITRRQPNYPLRLTANMNAYYSGCGYTTAFRITSNPISYGRVKLGGGSAAGAYKMRLRIIYSRL